MSRIELAITIVLANVIIWFIIIVAMNTE